MFAWNGRDTKHKRNKRQTINETTNKMTNETKTKTKRNKNETKRNSLFVSLRRNRAVRNKRVCCMSCRGRWPDTGCDQDSRLVGPTPRMMNSSTPSICGGDLINSHDHDQVTFNITCWAYVPCRAVLCCAVVVQNLRPFNVIQTVCAVYSRRRVVRSSLMPTVGGCWRHSINTPR